MASDFNIDLSRLLNLLEAISDEVANEEFMDDVAAIILNRVRTRFLSEVDSEGTPWPPSAAGLKRRAAGGTGTLFDTGRLFHSISVRDEGLGERLVYTDVPYAKYHQYPKSEIGRHRLPRREFIGVSQDDIKMIERTYIASLKRRLK